MAKTEIISLEAASRTEFGKGAARRTRRAGNIPAVIYGPGFEPVHVSVENISFTKIVRDHGINAVLDLDIEGEKELVMIKSVYQNPLTLEIDHADLLKIERGEKVEVEVPVVTAGEPAPNTMMHIETETLRIFSDVLSIPEEISVDVTDKAVGDQILASDMPLPEGAELVDDPELLIVNFMVPEVADLGETEEGEEGEEGAEAPEAEGEE